MRIETLFAVSGVVIAAVIAITIMIATSYKDKQYLLEWCEQNPLGTYDMYLKCVGARN